MGGPWNLTIYDKWGFSTRSSWTVDPSPLKGVQCSNSGYVPVLWFCGGEGQDFGSGVQLEVKVLSSVQALAAGLVVLVCYLWKSTQYLARNRIGPFWAGFAITDGLLQNLPPVGGETIPQSPNCEWRRTKSREEKVVIRVAKCAEGLAVLGRVHGRIPTRRQDCDFRNTE